MSLDVFGPASAPGSVTTRPGDGRTFGATDTFFNDCSSASVDDGTEFQAAWFNQVLANLRTTARGNGQTLAAVNIVTEDNADDALILKAIQHLIQRGKTNYGIDTGSATALVVAISPAPAELADGMVVRFVKSSTAGAGGATTFALNALGAKSLKRRNGLDPLASDLPASRPTEVMYNVATDTWVLLGATSTGGLCGDALNLTGSAPGSAKTATWTADEFIAESSLGGAIYKGSSLSLSFNGAGTGANGMDTGAVPTSSNLHIYAIYNPTTNTWGTLGTTASSTPTYTGSNMPSGYTASALLWSGKTDASANLYAWYQRGRAVEIVPVQIFFGINAATLTAQSVSAAVPPNARSVSGWLAVGTTGATDPRVASSSTGLGAYVGTGTAAYIANDQPTVTFTDLMLITTQVLYWSNGAGTGPSNNLNISKYIF